MQIEPGDKGRQLHIRFLYDESVLEAVRGLPGRRWHPAGKYWSVSSRHLEEVTRSLLPLGFVLSREVRRELRSHAPDLLDEEGLKATVVEPVEDVVVAVVAAPVDDKKGAKGKKK